MANHDPRWDRGARLSTGLVGLALGLLIAIIYGQVWRHGFVNFDDPMYLYENGHVTAGLTADGFRWAWVNKDVLQWHPLTWLGHMLVAELGGPGPRPHLLVNVTMHWMNAVLLFLWLRAATAAPGRSLAVALLFAVHPVNVETVAWASQLKSTLSTTLWLAALWAYTIYVQRGSRRAYWLAVLAGALGLLAKSMLVSLPLVLLLLDFWPLGRTPLRPGSHPAAGWRPVLVDKIPFVLLALAGAIVTAVPWGPHSDLHTVNALPWDRLVTVPINYVRYLGLLFRPVNLAVLYPEELGGTAQQLVGAPLLLAGLSVAVWRKRRAHPELLFGWAWFLITMLPVSGLIRLGPQGWADRYLYVPALGLFIAAVWWLTGRFTEKFRAAPAVLMGGAVLIYGTLSFAQVRYWENSLTLWRHAAAITPPSLAGHLNLGNALQVACGDREAESEFNAALALAPGDPRAYIDLALIAQKYGRAAEAIRLLRHALELSPNDARIHSNLGSLLQDTGDTTGARQHLERAIALRPEWAEAQTNFGVLLASTGDLPGALQHFTEAARLKPGDPTARHNLELVRRQIEQSPPKH